MGKKLILVALAVIFAFVPTLRAETGQVYTWTDENGNLHITNSPPPKNAQISDVMSYQQRSESSGPTQKQLQKEEELEDLKEKQNQQIEEAKRKAREADKRAKEAVARAEQVTKNNNAYIRRLGSTDDKRRQFKDRIQRLKEEAVLAQDVANSAIEDARRASDAVKELEEKFAKENQQLQKKTSQTTAGE